MTKTWDKQVVIRGTVTSWTALLKLWSDFLGSVSITISNNNSIVVSILIAGTNDKVTLLKGTTTGQESEWDKTPVF